MWEAYNSSLSFLVEDILRVRKVVMPGILGSGSPKPETRCRSAHRTGIHEFDTLLMV